MSLRAPHTARARMLIGAALVTTPGSPDRQRLLDRLDQELAALRRIEHGYTELVADAAEQQLLAEPAAGRA